MERGCPGRRPKAGDALFRWANGKLAIARVCIAKVKALLVRAKVSMSDFVSVSLRRGGALSMAEAGVEDRVIQQVGRWKSFAYRVYIDLTEQARQRAQQAAAQLEDE
jgi:hypothetical protein